MPKNVFVTHPMSQAYTPGGGISLELSPKAFTITRLLVVLRLNVTTGAGPGSYQDAFDRIITSLSLTGGSPSTTFFDFRNVRVARNALRFVKQFGSRRPTDLPATTANLLRTIGFMIHFGIAPRKLNPNTGNIEDNPYDLTAGIPPVAAGSLALQGTWGAANAGGTGWTVNDAPMDVYAWGVQPLAGDPPESYQPRAFPKWSTASPGVGGTSAQAGTPYNIPAGDFLRTMVIETHLGAGTPRSDGVLSDLKIYDQLNSRDIWRADRISGGVLALQAPVLDFGVPPGDDGVTLNVPTVAADHEPGIYPLWFYQQTRDGDPLFGADMRNLATGDLQLQFGVANATAAEFWAFFERYGRNPAHPLNQSGSSASTAGPAIAVAAAA